MFMFTSHVGTLHVSYTKDILSRFIIASTSTVAGVVVVVCYTQHSSIVDTPH